MRGHVSQRKDLRCKWGDMYYRKDLQKPMPSLDEETNQSAHPRLRCSDLVWVEGKSWKASPPLPRFLKLPLDPPLVWVTQHLYPHEFPELDASQPQTASAPLLRPPRRGVWLLQQGKCNRRDTAGFLKLVMKNKMVVLRFSLRTPAWEPSRWVVKKQKDFWIYHMWMF